MSFQEAVRAGFENYFNFQGRATRPEYWWWVLFAFSSNLVAQVIDAYTIGPMLGFSLGDESAGQPLSLLVGLGLMIPSIAAAVRRMHDTGRSGFWILIAFIPVLGLIAFIYFAVQPTKTEDNQFA